MIVAWHEVPGTAPPQMSRPVGYGMIRTGVLRRVRRLEGGNFECGIAEQNKLATGDGVFSVGISQARSITLSTSSNIIGHKSFKKSIWPS
jgi:hypothetical protein